MSNPKSLNGVWTCAEDNGTYCIRQFKDQAGTDVLLWYGEGNAHNQKWTNVCKGVVFEHGQVGHEITNINAVWADVPCGDTTASGTLILKATKNEHGDYVQLTKQEGSSPYWGKVWNRKS